MTKHSTKKAGSKKKFKKDLFEKETSNNMDGGEKSQFKIKTPHKHNQKQKAIFEKMLASESKIVMIDGLWGTSKTYCAVLSALKLLQQGVVEKFYYIRNPVESSNTTKIGLLPGGVEDKMQIHVEILYDKLQEFLDPLMIKLLTESKTIECLPPSFLRGRNFSNAVIVCDEASNFSWEEFLLISTRMAENSRMFIVGDTFQNDIGRKTGFKKYFDTFNDQESAEKGIHCFEMKDPQDIVRSGIIRYIMEKTGVLKV